MAKTLIPPASGAMRPRTKMNQHSPQHSRSLGSLISRSLYNHRSDLSDRTITAIRDETPRPETSGETLPAHHTRKREQATGVLREWLFNITGRASEFRNSTSHYLKLYRDHSYWGPHSVGCYLSHWHALKDVAERPLHLRPKVLFVFEDDAACIPKTVERTLEILASLPDDWDLFYPGGKPFSYYDNA